MFSNEKALSNQPNIKIEKWRSAKIGQSAVFFENWTGKTSSHSINVGTFKHT